MKINISTFNRWINVNISINNIIKNLNNLGFESYIDTKKLNISVPFNRKDCNNLFSLVNELSTTCDLNIKQINNEYCKNFKNKIKIKIEDYNFCPKYSSVIIKNINNNINTPVFIKDELYLNNIKPVSIIVDIINYVTILTGQPLHAYNLSFINKYIVLRHAKFKEEIILLDGTKKILDTDAFVIANKKHVLAIPGLIGCNIAKINNNTTSIFLESALFNSCEISNMSKKYNIETYASIEFKKQKSLDIQTLALKIAIKLFKDLILSKNSNIVIKQNKKFFPKCKKIILYKKNLHKLLGIIIKNKKVNTILSLLNMTVIEFKHYWKVSIPLYREDLVIEENIIADIIRHYGFHNIPYKSFKTKVYAKDYKNNKHAINDAMNFLVKQGFHEIITYSFVDSKLEKLLFAHENLLFLQNPISIKMNVMRTSLLQGLLTSLKFNLNRQHEIVQFFECGTVFKNINNKLIENKVISGLCVETKFKSYNKTHCLNSFFTIKYILEQLCKILSNNYKLQFKKKKFNIFDKMYSVQILLNDKPIGMFGILNKTILQTLTLDQILYFFEIELFYIPSKQKLIFLEFSKYPLIKRDLSIFIHKNLSYYSIKMFIYNLKLTYLKRLSLLDIYLNKHLLVENKSITLSLIFQDDKKTLKDIDVNIQLFILLDEIYKQFKARLRNI